ncbi:MAG: type II toxin-antitoxin system RelE/ParE family toxin [Bacteroidota bacterium]
MKKIRQIIFYEGYFMDFYLDLPKEVQEKIEYIFAIIRQVDQVPEKFLKHIEDTDGLYEIRIEYKGNIYRVFCCFDKGQLVVLFNGFQKKTAKTPKKEIDLAIKLKNEYFNNKTKQK